VNNPNWFSNAPEHAANRAAARRISLQLITAFDPERLAASDRVLEDLITEAGYGRIVPKGGNTFYGNGSLDLLAQVIVPAVVGALSALMTVGGVTTIRKLTGAIGLDEEAERRRIELIEQSANMALPPETFMALMALLEIFKKELEERQMPPPDFRKTPQSYLTDTLKAEMLRQQFAALAEEYKAVGAQILSEIDPRTRVRLTRQRDQLEQEIQVIEQQIQAVMRHLPPDPPPLSPDRTEDLLC